MLKTVEQLSQLHDEYGQERAVRISLAIALAYLTCAFAEKADKSERFKNGISQLKKLHTNFGNEAPVRYSLAIALAGVACACVEQNHVNEALNAMKQLYRLDVDYEETETLPDEESAWSPVRLESYAEALKAVGVADASYRNTAIQRLTELSHRFPEETYIQEALQALSKVL